MVLDDKVGVLFVGLNGCVATTAMVAAKAIAQNLYPAQGFHTETSIPTYANGKKDFRNKKRFSEMLNLVDFKNLVFGGWDINRGSVYEHLRKLEDSHQGVVPELLVEELGEQLQGVVAWPGVFSPRYIRNLQGNYLIQAEDLREKVATIQDNIREFKSKQGLDRIVMVNVASTEAYTDPTNVHQSLADFESGLTANDPNISPAQVYAYSALREKVPYINFTPSRAEECLALRELAIRYKVPTAGKDGKTGQTRLKTLLAETFRDFDLRLDGPKDGWLSFNSLGNNDGKVLDDPASLLAKNKTKSGVLDTILGYHPQHHKVIIAYHPPDGDNKEAWDKIDCSGVFGMDMHIRLNFMCRDSILAAPAVLDLVRLMDYAKRQREYGVQEQLSLFFKSPDTKRVEDQAVHAYSEQRDMLHDWIYAKLGSK